MYVAVLTVKENHMLKVFDQPTKQYHPSKNSSQRLHMVPTFSDLGHISGNSKGIALAIYSVGQKKSELNNIIASLFFCGDKSYSEYCKNRPNDSTCTVRTITTKPTQTKMISPQVRTVLSPRQSQASIQNSVTASFNSTDTGSTSQRC